MAPTNSPRTATGQAAAFSAEPGHPLPSTSAVPSPISFDPALFQTDHGRPLTPPPPPKSEALAQSVPSTETPESVALYARRVEEACADGKLEDWELDQLEKLRAKLGIRHATHDRLLAQHRLTTTSGFLLALAVEEKSIQEFQAGQRGVVRWRIVNPLTDAVYRLVVYHGIDGKSGVDTHRMGSLKPGGSDDFALSQQLDEAGQFQLNALIACESDIGEQHHFYAEAVTFRVATAAATGPQVVHMNIDMSSAKVAQLNDVGLGSATNRTEATGGLMSGAKWRELKLTSTSPPDFATRLQRLESGPPTRTSSMAGRVSGAGEQKQSWSGDLSSVSWIGSAAATVTPGQRTVRWSSGMTTNEVIVLPSSTVTFGRDPTRANIRLAVEPYAPPEEFQDNFNKSMRFSGLHCSVTIGEVSAEFAHLGSTPSTFVGDALLTTKLVIPRAPMDMVLGRDAQYPSGSLTLRLRVLPQPSGRVGAVLIERRNNIPERSYLQVVGAIPLAVSPLDLDVIPEKASVFLSSMDGRVVLVNVGDAVQTSAGVLGKNSGLVLQPGLTLAGVGWTATVD